METTINKATFSERLDKHLFEKGESNDELFKSLNVLSEYLQLKTVKQYAEDKGKSVQSVYQYESEKIKDFLGIKVVIDNI